MMFIDLGPRGAEQVADDLERCPFCAARMLRYHGSCFFHPGTVSDKDCILSGQGFREEEAEAWNSRAAPVDRSGEAGETRRGSTEGESAVGEAEAPSTTTIAIAPNPISGTDKAREMLDERSLRIGAWNALRSCGVGQEACYPIIEAIVREIGPKLTLPSSPLVGEGLVVVPKEPTREMIEAAPIFDEDRATEIYRAMIAVVPAAAPSPLREEMDPAGKGKLPLQDRIETILIRRLYQKRIEGYTLQTAHEIAAIVSSSSIGETEELTRLRAWAFGPNGVKWYTARYAEQEARIEELRKALEEIRSRRQRVMDSYERNGPQWTSPTTGDEYESTCYVVEAAREDVELLDTSLASKPLPPTDDDDMSDESFTALRRHVEAQKPPNFRLTPIEPPTDDVRARALKMLASEYDAHGQHELARKLRFGHVHESMHAPLAALEAALSAQSSPPANGEWDFVYRHSPPLNMGEGRDCAKRILETPEIFASADGIIDMYEFDTAGDRACAHEAVRIALTRLALATPSLPEGMDIPDELRELSEKATAGQWELQDGCSWRRIGTRERDGAVLCPSTYSREDRHPDLTCGRGEDLHANLRFIVALVNWFRQTLATSPSSDLIGGEGK